MFTFNRIHFFELNRSLLILLWIWGSIWLKLGRRWIFLLLKIFFCLSFLKKLALLCVDRDLYNRRFAFYIFFIRGISLCENPIMINTISSLGSGYFIFDPFVWGTILYEFELSCGILFFLKLKDFFLFFLKLKHVEEFFRFLLIILFLTNL